MPFVFARQSILFCPYSCVLLIFESDIAIQVVMPDGYAYADSIFEFSE